MRTTLISFLTLFILLPRVSLAGQETGNGGDAVVCRNRVTGEIDSAKVLDYEEAPQVREPSIPENVKEGEELARVLEVLSPIRIVSPSMYDSMVSEARMLLAAIDEYRINNNHFPENVTFVHTELPDIPDSGFTPLQDCKIEQLAIRLSDPKDIAYYKTSFLFQGDIIDELNPTGITGIVTHEVLFGHAISALNVPDSRSSRTLNRALTYAAGDLSWIQTADLLKAAGYGVVQGSSFEMDLQSLAEENGMHRIRVLSQDFPPIIEAGSCAIRTAILDSEGNVDRDRTIGHVDNRPYKIYLKLGAIAKYVSSTSINFDDVEYDEVIRSVDVLVDGKSNEVAKKNFGELIRISLDAQKGVVRLDDLDQENAYMKIEIPYDENGDVSFIIQGNYEAPLMFDYLLRVSQEDYDHSFNQFGGSDFFDPVLVVKNRLHRIEPIYENWSKYEYFDLDGGYITNEDVRFQVNVNRCDSWQ